MTLFVWGGDVTSSVVCLCYGRYSLRSCQQTHLILDTYTAVKEVAAPLFTNDVTGWLLVPTKSNPAQPVTWLF